MTITALPTAPSRSDAPATFISRADAFVAALPGLVTELNDFAAALNNLATNGSSATSLSIGTGTKSLTADTGKSWQVGMILRLAYTTDATKWMSGEVTAYDSGTGAMTINVTATSSSGTYAAWTISAAAGGGATLVDIQSGASIWLGSVAGTNTITATASPTLAAYAAGQRFAFAAAGANTGAVTLNIDGLGAKAITRDGSTALRENAILSGAIVTVQYDGTRFQVIGQPQRVTPGSASGTGANCVAVSTNGTALAAQTIAANATAVGNDALAALTTGLDNTGIGRQAGAALTTANNNTMVGSAAGYQTTSAGNTLVGTSAMNGTNSGANLVGIGYNVCNGQNITGSNNIVIGANASVAAVGDSNTFTLGASIATLRCATTTITSISDQRDKAEITDLDLGLPFVSTLRPRRFRWASRDESHPRDGELEAGFIAQELATAQANAGAEYLELVFSSNPDRLEASPGKLLPILVKAVQDLAAETAELRARLAAAGIP